MSEIADILDRAANLIEPEGCWTQGYYARTAKGRPIGFSSPKATCFCALGAVRRASNDEFERTPTPAVRFLSGQWGDDLGRVVSWNDAPDRTQAQVVAKLREAAAKAREQSA